MKKIIYSFCILIYIFSFSFIFAKDETDKIDPVQNISNKFEFKDYIFSINEELEKNGIEKVNLEDLVKNLIQNGDEDYSSIWKKIGNIIFNEISGALKGSIGIFIIIVIIGVISSMELESNSEIAKIAHLVCFLAIAAITISTFISVIDLFKNVTLSLTNIIQIISPFLMGILIATGSITSTGIIQPLILFLASATSFIINYVVIPFLSISVALNVICSMCESLKLSKVSNLFNKSALWIVGVLLTVFLGVLSLETSLTSSVDSLAVKTTQSAVSNFVPVVGKFFSDSFETVVGATKIVGKVGGAIGIIAIILIVSIPVIKILAIMVIYYILAAIIEPITSDVIAVKYIAGFAEVYKTLLGILIGFSILFIISSGIVLNLISSVIK